MKIGLLGDLHSSFVKNDILDRHVTEAPERLAAFLEAASECDFFLNLGDLIDGCGDIELDRKSMKEAVETLESAGKTVYHAVGNHDLAIPRKELYGFYGIPSGDYSFLREGVRFIILEANFEADGVSDSTNWTHAHLGEKRLNWLKETLSRGDFKWAVVVTHQCLDELSPQGESDDDAIKHVIKDYAAAQKIIAESGKVPLVISAHYHYGKMRPINGVMYYTLPSACIFESANFGILEIDPESGRLGVEQHGIKVKPTVLLGDNND